MNLQELREEKGRLAEQADQILKKAGEEGRKELREDENVSFDKIHDDIEKRINPMILRLERQEAVAVSLAVPSGRRSEPNPVEQRGSAAARPNGFVKATMQDAEMALRGWLMHGGAGKRFVTEEHRAAAARMGIDLADGSLTVRMFGKEALRSTREADVEAWEKRAALGVGSTTIGGYTVPDAPMGSLERALLAFGGMRQTSTILRTDTGADLPIPTNDDTANKGARLGENTQVTELDMTFGQLVMQAYKYSSKSVLVSTEFLQDSSIDAMGFIGSALATRIGRIQNDEFTTGTGSSQPNGIVTASTSSGVTSSAATACTYDNLIDVIHSVDPAYREGGSFMLHDSALKMIKKVKVLQYSGDTVGAPLWVPGVNGLPDNILGYPYVINQSLATVATTTKSLLFGALSKYIIREAREVELIRLNERYADYHQVGFLAFARADGDLLDAGTHPVKYMTQA